MRRARLAAALVASATLLLSTASYAQAPSAEAASPAPPAAAPPAAAPPAAAPPAAAPPAAAPTDPAAPDAGAAPTGAISPDALPGGFKLKQRPRRFVTWDLNLEGGVGYAFAKEGDVAGFGRVRGGVTLVDSSEVAAPKFYSLGFFADGANLETEVAYGVQGELLDLNSGFWLQVGAAVDTAPRPVFLGSLGWSILGAEAQCRFDPDAGAYAAVFGKLRIPIGIIAAASR